MAHRSGFCSAAVQPAFSGVNIRLEKLHTEDSLSVELGLGAFEHFLIQELH